MNFDNNHKTWICQREVQIQNCFFFFEWHLNLDDFWQLFSRFGWLVLVLAGCMKENDKS